MITLLGCARIHKEPFFDKWDQKCLNLNYYLLEEKKALKGESIVAYGDYIAAIGEIITFTANSNNLLPKSFSLFFMTIHFYLYTFILIFLPGPSFSI